MTGRTHEQLNASVFIGISVSMDSRVIRTSWRASVTPLSGGAPVSGAGLELARSCDLKHI
jgi:hypothetical protein